ncbi:MAG: helix-turn-helix transcriptional regulator [Acidimicrobiales bacterium]
MEDRIAGRRHLRTEDWERSIGSQVRDLRLHGKHSQRALARDANISLSALQRLEAGQGTSVSTLVSVLRALGREGWLEQLAPPVTVSPMAQLRARRQEEATRPRRAPRQTTGPPATS